MSEISKMLSNIKVIAFDADDTLWVNEPYYRETEYKFAALLSEYLSEKECIGKLFEIEMQNLEIYGYGAKAFVLSMIETALKISDYKISSKSIEKIISSGQKKKDVRNDIDVGTLALIIMGSLRLLVKKWDLNDHNFNLNKEGVKLLAGLNKIIECQVNIK